MYGKRIAAGALVTGLLFTGAACEPTGQPTTPTDGTTPGTAPAPRDPGLGMDTTTDRDLIVQPLAQRLDSVRLEIEQLRADEDRVPQENRAAFESAMSDVQSGYSNAVLHVDRLRAAEGAQLTQMRTQVDPIMDELDEAVQRARALIGAQQPGQQQPMPQEPTEPMPPPTGGA